MNEDAAQSAARSEAGKFNVRFNEFYFSVKLEITNAANNGETNCTYTVNKANEDLVTLAIERLEAEDYVVERTANLKGLTVLKISWNAAGE